MDPPIDHKQVLATLEKHNWSIVELPGSGTLVPYNKQSWRKSESVCPLCGSSCSYDYFPFLNKIFTHYMQNPRRQATSNHDIPEHFVLNNYYGTFFHEIRSLGRGAYGQVYLCEHVIDQINLGRYAIKKIPVGNSKEWLLKMIREVKMREALNHENIVSYKHSWLEESTGTSFNAVPVPWLFVLMEYCDGDDLEALVERVYTQDNDYLTEEEIWVLFVDILMGLQHLHHRGIIHRDLKPSNIMLKVVHEIFENDMELEQIHCCLSDFGTADYVNNPRSGAGFTGTMEYTAPELLYTDSTGSFRATYDFKNDVWSCGWILYYLAYGQLPFGETTAGPEGLRKTILELKQMMKNDALPSNCIPLAPINLERTSHQQVIPIRSIHMRNCISALLHPHLEKRPSVDSILLMKDKLPSSVSGIRNNLWMRIGKPALLKKSHSLLKLPNNN